MKLKKIALAACAASVLAAPMAAMADTATANLTVKITISGKCTVTDATLDFLTHPDLTGSDVTEASAFNVECSNGLPYNLGLDNGNNFSNPDRRMQRGATGEYIKYGLYRDSTHNDAWGDTIGTNTLSGTGSGVPQSIPVYGRVPGAQGLPTAGVYTDTVLITVTY